MIKIKKTDSIIDIINKIINSKDKNIIIEFPFWHPILHNYLSLKILKNKAAWKILTIVTSDLTSKKIWKTLWIKYSLIKDPDFIKEENLLKHNYTFIEYLRFEIKKYINEISDIVLRNKKINSIKKFSKKYNSNPIWLWLSITWLLFSILLLFFIFYFAVNKTYIYITPEIEVKTKSKNFIFVENTDNRIENSNKIIKLKKITESLQITDSFITSGIREGDIKRAKWKAVLINNTIESVNLIEKTRLLTWSWILYEIIWNSFIPSWAISNSGTIIPWKAIVNIISKIRNIKWNISWKKSNIKSWTTLTIPWLKDEENKIYAVSKWNIYWANNTYTNILSKKDLTTAKNRLEEKLKKEVFDKIKLQISKDNKNNNTNYDILNVNNIVIYDSIEIEEIWDLKIWNEMKNFKLIWNITATTYTYNKETVINKLRNTIKDLSLEEIENILLIDEKSLRVSNRIYTQKKPFEIKATMEIEVYYSQNFLDKNNSYIEKLKWSILWLNKDNAKKILLNNSKISNAQIETRPFFIKKISTIPDNIVFKVEN